MACAALTPGEFISFLVGERGAVGRPGAFSRREEGASVHRNSLTLVSDSWQEIVSGRVGSDAIAATLAERAGAVSDRPYNAFFALPFAGFRFGFALASAARRAAPRPSDAQRTSSSASARAIAGKRQKEVGIGLPWAT
jgi:hypothetical protein